MSLNQVEKPVRYIGQEWNAVLSKPEAKLRMAVAYPDVYEVGMSYLGLQILYGLLNEQPWIWCERTFAPWPDLEHQMRSNHSPLATLESGLPLNRLDILGFSLQHEMLYTNVLTMLDLGGIPLRAADRTDSDPLVIAGGPCTYNPAPMVDFIDVFVNGEGEEVVLELCSAILEGKQSNRSRSDILRDLGKIDAVFAPSLYRETTNRLGERFPRWSMVEGVPDVVQKRIVMDFENSYYPTRQVVPNTKIIHHRLALEVMRGCPGGCRFCQAGYTDRPVRERSMQRLMKDAEDGLKQTGFNEVGLLSLSTADYTQLPSLCSGLVQQYLPQKISLSLPSLRVDSFPSRVTEEIGKIRSTGLTFAPEAGTERLRWAINKLIYDAEIYAKVRESVSSNQDTVKFYFMVGLPTETDEDLQGIVDLVLNIKRMLKEEKRHRAKIHVGLSPFVPKPHTAYQWYGQISLKEIERRVDLVRSQLKTKGIKVNWHDPYKSLVEGALSRGDSRLGAVIQSVWEQGGRFDEWGEHFSFERWEAAFQAHGLSLKDYAAKTYENEDILPWDSISIRVDKRYLWREWEKTFREKESRHCGNEMCRVCKVCDGDEIVTIHADRTENAPVSKYNMEHELVANFGDLHVCESTPVDMTTVYRYRIQYSKTQSLVYASHHDLMMLFESVFRRTGLSLAFTEGFHPHPKITFAAPLAVGIEGLAEYMDIQIYNDIDPVEMKEIVQRQCPQGLTIHHIEPVPSCSPKLPGLVEAFQYQVKLLNHTSIEHGWIHSIEHWMNQPDIKREFNLIQIEFHSIDSKTVQMVYTCEVQGGKYTKAELLCSRLNEWFDLNFQIVQCGRLGVFLKSENNNIESLINSKNKIDTKIHAASNIS